MKKFFAVFLFIVISVSTVLSSSKPYVLLISFDGFRWDYLNRGLSPNLESIRDNGASAVSLRPAFPTKTFPNHQSMITGMYIENHGIISNNFWDRMDNSWYGMQDTISTRDSRWYLGEAFWETAERNNIITASYFWPGSEMQLEYRHPTYYLHYDHYQKYKQKIDGVIDWLKLPQDKRPHFITLYFHETDTYGHDFGPNSEQANNAIKYLDTAAGYLFHQLKEINLYDSLDVIFVSDHGMTEISPERSINIQNIINEYDCHFNDYGPFMQVEPAKEELETVFELLKKNENHYKVYLKEKMPEYFHYSKNPFIYSIIIVADLGWSLVTNTNSDWIKNAKGNHGYDNNQMDMHGIFLAEGPHFKKGYRTGTVWNIDIYPLLCKIFDIYPRSNIDGNLERIEFILNE